MKWLCSDKRAHYVRHFQMVIIKFDGLYKYIERFIKLLSDILAHHCVHTRMYHMQEMERTHSGSGANKENYE